MRGTRFLLSALLLASCSSPNARAVVDASSNVADATPDADTGMIEVSLLRGTVPIAGAPVVTHDADGNPLLTYMTDQSGNVHFASAGVDMVTVIDTDATQLYTAIGVRGGDHIVIPTYAVIPTYGTLAVTLPSPPEGAVGFQAFLGDDFGGGTTVSTPFSIATTGLDVNSDGTITVIGLARDASYNIIAVSTATGITPPAQGTTADVATGAWSTAFDEFHLNVTNGNLGSIVNATEGQNIGGVEYALPSLSGNTSYIRWWPLPTLGGYVDYSAQIPYGTVTSGENPANRFEARRLPPDATADAIDIAALLPGLTGTTASSTDLARPTLTWSASASTASADGVILNTQWNGDHAAQWAFLMPSTQMTVRFPALPASLAMWVPDQAVSQPYAVLIDTSYDDTYADFRADGFGLVSGPKFLHDGTGALHGSMYFPQAFEAGVLQRTLPVDGSSASIWLFLDALIATTRRPSIIHALQTSPP